MTVHVDETPLVFTTYNDQQLGVVRNLTDLGIPKTFEETTVSLGEEKVTAYHSNQYNLTILYLAGETGEENFYIYEEDMGITSLFRPISLIGRNVVLYDLTEEEQVRENMIYKELTIDGITLKGWVYENNEYDNYAQIPVMNEFGEKIIYQYEKTENSLQLYKEYAAKDNSAEEEESETIPITLFYVAAGAAAILFLITVIMIIRYAGLKKKYHIM